MALPAGTGNGRDGRDLENGRDLEVQPLVKHFAYDPNSRWHRFKMSLIEPPKSTVSIYADIPFNHAEWKRHRNAAWRHRPQPVLFMRVAGGFWWQLTYVFILSVLVGLYHHQIGSVTAGAKLAVPFNLTTFALSLLLVFRTNSSYSRWWEARTVWGAVVNLSRNYARQSMLWLPASKARVAVRWMMAAPYLLKCHLRFNASVRENVSHVLLPQELDWVLSWTHRPNAAAHVLATAVSEGGLDTNRELILMELVNTFIDCVGKCERIFKTPIPAAYTRHTSRYLMIYLTACPIVLWPNLSWWTPIVATLVTFLLLGTENIGVQLEEPFRVLPLDDMCRGIEATLREMERHHNTLGTELPTWQADPEGMPRASSASSLDSFIDGPADGPSEPEALKRFHNIPPPKPLAAAAHALRASLRMRSGELADRSGTTAGDRSVTTAADRSVAGDRSAAGGGLGGLLHAVMHPHPHGHAQGHVQGHSPGGGALRSAGGSGCLSHGGEAEGHSGSGHSSAGLHHRHHPHRHLEGHPADVPGLGLGGVASPRSSRLSFDKGLHAHGSPTEQQQPGQAGGGKRPGQAQQQQQVQVQGGAGHSPFSHVSLQAPADGGGGAAGGGYGAPGGAEADNVPLLQAHRSGSGGGGRPAGDAAV